MLLRNHFSVRMHYKKWGKMALGLTWDNPKIGSKWHWDYLGINPKSGPNGFTQKVSQNGVGINLGLTQKVGQNGIGINLGLTQKVGQTALHIYAFHQWLGYIQRLECSQMLVLHMVMICIRGNGNG